MKPDDKVGIVAIVGFGGLADLAAQLPTMGPEVTVFSRTKEKLDEPARLGVTGACAYNSKVRDKLKASVNFILSMVSESHDINHLREAAQARPEAGGRRGLKPMAPVENSEVAFHASRSSVR